MATTTRAKFRCLTETQIRYSTQGDPQRTYEFSAQYDHTVPEDESFSKSTPIGNLKIVVDNPAVSFEPGQAYYIDITPAEAG